MKAFENISYAPNYVLDHESPRAQTARYVLEKLLASQKPGESCVLSVRIEYKELERAGVVGFEDDLNYVQSLPEVADTFYLNPLTVEVGDVQLLTRWLSSWKMPVEEHASIFTFDEMLLELLLGKIS